MTDDALNEKAVRSRALHDGPVPVPPNAWDPVSAPKGVPAAPAPGRRTGNARRRSVRSARRGELRRTARWERRFGQE